MDKKKSRILRRCIIGFVVFLLAITYLSRVIYLWSLPNVFLGFGGPETFTRDYEMWGTVRLTDEYAGYEAVSDFLIPAADLPPPSRNYVNTGDSVFLDVKSAKDARLTGTVVETGFDESGARMTVGFNSAQASRAADNPLELEGGEDILAVYTNSIPHDFVVPSSAVYQLGPDFYLLAVREETGAFGREFVATMLEVSVVDEWYGKTAVYLPGIITTEPLVLNADRPVAPGGKVRFYS